MILYHILKVNELSARKWIVLNTGRMILNGTEFYFELRNACVGKWYGQTKKLSPREIESPKSLEHEAGGIERAGVYRLTKIR